MDIEAIRRYLFDLQSDICQQLKAIGNEQDFRLDKWRRDDFGEGCSAVLEQGNVIERGGVNVSHVKGEKLPPAATQKRPELAGCHFQALGLSLVIHPRNPHAPTSHANIRFFCAEKPDMEPVWWFGGGFDLTPYYGYDEDCIHWHQMAKQACDPFGTEVYQQYKQHCDDYFFLPHRNEARGIGGLFFDDLNEWGFERCFDFMRSIGQHYLLAYTPILQRRKDSAYTEEQRQFQLYRRGRYVEFNLVYDRGTLFGLQSKGRIESILMSMPPNVNWRYNWQPSPGSQEALLYEKYLVPQNWLDHHIAEESF